MIKLGHCTLNPNHWYSLHAAECPWCKIHKEEGRDFFPHQNAPINQINPVVKSDITGQGIPQHEIPQGTLPGSHTFFSDRKFQVILVIGLIIIAAIIIIPLTQKKMPVTYSTPPPTYPSQTYSVPTPIPTPIHTPIGKNAEVTLPYMETIALRFNTVTRNFTSTKAPIYITLTTKPDVITDNKIIFRGPSDTQGTEIPITRPDENAYSKIIVRDLEMGGVVDEAGYGKSDSSTPQKIIKIMKSGRYELEITGNRAIMDLSIGT